MGNSTSSPVPGLPTVPPSSIGSSSGHRGGFLGAFLSGRRLDFTLANMRQLHAQLTRFASLPDAEIVELLRVLSEFLIYSDQHRVSVELEDQVDESPDVSPGSFFDYFGETNMLALLVELGGSAPSVAVQVQLLQTMSILVQNIATRTSLYFILSNNHVNRLLECPFAVDHNDDVRDWYVTLLKALSLRLNEETVQFFLDTQGETASFPLYARALRFGRCHETMVKVAVKTLTLNVLKVPDARVRRFILQHDDLNYFRDIVELANDLTLQLQGLLNAWPVSEDDAAATSAETEKLEEAVDEYIDHCFYLQDLLDVNVPELCYKVGDLLFSRHVKRLLATSVVPDCAPPPQRVSTRLALYLLTRLMGILEHTPLVNAVAFMLLSPDATEDCEYSAVALGAGSKRRHHRPEDMELEHNNGNREDMTMAVAEEDASSAPSLRWDKEAPPTHAFRAHSATTCDSPLCYVQTRFGMGEWPVDEVKAFVPQGSNCYRQALLTLIESSDERLSSAVVLLLLAIVNNQAVDHSLLRELDLLPFRHRRGHSGNGKTHNDEMRSAGSSVGRRRPLSADDNDQTNSKRHQGKEDIETEADDAVLPSTASVSSSCSSSSTSQRTEVENEADEMGEQDESKAGSEENGTNEEEEGASESPRHEDSNGLVAESVAAQMNAHSACHPSKYPHWLIDSLLKVLARNTSTRVLSVQLCARLLVDMMVDTHSLSPHRLIHRHAAALHDIHSSSAHLVMESMRGVMAEVDLFIYVLEDEVATFERMQFPMELQLQSSSPFEYLVPLERDEPAGVEAWAGARDTLAIRSPADEMEVCRKAMRVFLTLRKLRELLDATYVDDELEQLVVYRHPRTGVLAEAATAFSSSAAPLDGMVSLKCMYREQRFLLTATKLLMVLNPEAFVLVEKVPDLSDDVSPRAEGQGEGIVKLFAPIHRTYCMMDPRDDRVLQVSVRSVVPVAGCRKEKKASSMPGTLADWSVSLMFPTAEDCSQAQAHINLSGTEVRAFKLRQIEESLTTHMQVTQSSNKGQREFVGVRNGAMPDEDDGKTGEAAEVGNEDEVEDDEQACA
ncbi:hypothetical protein BBJ28_00002951 [Nothophytophthora sp. Chile5]|nr:hypothetical protein BBJ28_00002951 [Nothophytophthora sp. Chile5]